ncbi:chromatin remodeling factor-like protein [Phanerochaete sordida]|uniref:Chromatin remodeling factor-like protein n=1 Tax=Phanerochaete sordida TaxID=48140 RepID=A0A9P3L9J2_9APHY|nr:chromatin remodeling factor-like protein [Phanerochaete sordida]
MSDDAQEVELLFATSSPRQSDVEMLPEAASRAQSEETSAELSRLSTLSIAVQRDRVYVEPPALSSEDLARYADLADLPVASDESPDGEMERIIGEYETRGGLQYFVRMSNGIAYRFPARGFGRKHRELVDDYEQRRREGTLEPFDPSASYIHPDSRVKLTLKVGPSTRPRSIPVISDSEEELVARRGYSTPPESDDDAFIDDGEDNIPVQRSTRAITAAKSNGKKQATLPFSPKKTRSRKIISLVEDDEEEESSPAPRPAAEGLRRSTRSTKRTRDNLDDEEFIDDGEYAPRSKSHQPKKKPQPKKPIRGYGIVHGNSHAFAEEPGTSAHRRKCEKCQREPTHKLIPKTKGKKRKSRKAEDDFEDDEDDDDRIAALGGWVRCMRCPIVAHWGCLAKTQRDEILRAIYEKDKAKWELEQDADPENPPPEPVKRTALTVDETTEFICGSCMKGGVCMACKKPALEVGGVIVSADGTKHAAPSPPPAPTTDGDVTMIDLTKDSSSPPAEESDAKNNSGAGDQMLYRCLTCKRVAHYEHLPLSRFADPNETYTLDEIAEYYQVNTGWQCADCVSFTYNVEHVIAWRPFPEDAKEPPVPPGELPNFKSALPREYLVKWTDRSYKRLHWVPHMWLLATYPAKLKNFLLKGPTIPLLPEPVADDAAVDLDLNPAFAPDEDDIVDDSEGRARKDDGDISRALNPMPDAERRVPPGWKTVDRVLDVLLWLKKSRVKKAPRGKKGRRIVDDEDDGDSDEELDEETRQERDSAYDEGEQPGVKFTETIEDFERREKRQITIDDVSLVAWGFFKWAGLGYEDSAWESPPRREDAGWSAFESAFERFLSARDVVVPVISKDDQRMFDDRPKNGFMRNYKFTPDSQPELGQAPSFKLMPFQVDGVNWLCNNWWNLQHCILADEMGLGKTVQIATFLGQVIKGFDKLPFSAYPALVVVPNSTITNWIRELERWAPNLRAVPFYGDAKAREIIREYELVHPAKKAKTTGHKFHVLVTTYETFTNARDVGTLFKAVPRWEVLVVDEGQRLKSDSSLLFKKLKELNTIHRIILTGTPLNNNIRELFNLMNFLDSKEWNDLEGLAKEHEELNEEKIKELHIRLRPYFLRRIKSEVLQLPPKNEVIVPVSMTALQKEVYRSILSQNVDVLRSIALNAAGAKVNAAVKKSNMNNILMQLRKCIQHPYLVSRDIEPTGLSAHDAHERLIGASAKLFMLKMMLPKLKARGHRVLLFSQFAIALDIIEDFLNGEGIKYLRLDGSTKQADRQKGMDEFNKPGSDVFIYILSTRAGGVGINLTTADTVIIFDPDFNPHQDLQAIARAHRYGQKKTCLVFKFMVKDSAEERIVQTGKKKLVLDHLIVQKMDDKDSDEDVKSILMFGAQALFESNEAQSSRDIHYSDHDIQQLIEKTEKEGDQQEPAAGENAGFSFAKVWTAEKDEEAEEQAQEDAWAQTLARIAEEKAKERAQEETGRGVRRKAAAVFPQQMLDLPDTPTKGKEKDKKGKGKQKAHKSDDDAAFDLSEVDDSDAPSAASDAASDDLDISLADQLNKQKQKRKKSRYIDSVQGKRASPSAPLSPIHNRLSLGEIDPTCGLCGLEHPNRPCFMTESSENLAEYRRILMTVDSGESLEERRAAIAVIDETLAKRGKMKLVIGQPLHPVEAHPRIPSAPRMPAPPPARQPVAQHIPTISTTLRPVPPAPKPRPVVNGSSGSTAASSSKATTSKVPQSHPKLGQPVAAGSGSLRRPSSPHVAEPPRKKVKESASSSSAVRFCIVCGTTPMHTLSQCPAVLEGPERIQKEIRRLGQDPAKSGTVEVLQKLLQRQMTNRGRV